MKFVTWRVAGPAPRISTATSSAGPYRGVSRRSQRAVANATSPPDAETIVTVASRGTYAKSVTLANTDDRPARTNSSPSHRTVTSVAEIGRTHASDSPVAMERSTPGANESTRNPVNDHPASSGVSAIGSVPSASEP